MVTVPSSLYDVVIIGAGPTGLHLAGLLAEKGLEVCVIERKKSVSSDVACAGVISLNTVHEYDIPAHLIRKKMGGVKVLLENGKEYFVDISHSAGVIIDREGFNHHLEQRALCHGAKIVTEARTEGVLENKHCVYITYRHQERQKLIKARFVVLATGSDNTLAVRSGLKPPPVQFTGFHQILPGLWKDEYTLVYYAPSLLGSGFGWIIPEKKSQYRTGILTPGNAPLAVFKEFLRRHNINGNEKNFRPLKRRINQGLSPLAAKGRIALAGEAAGLVKTTTGGGISFGMKSAEILACELMRVFHRGQSDLRSVTTAFASEFHAEIEAGFRIRKVVSSLSLAKVTLIADFISADGIMNRLQSMFKFDKHSTTISEFMDILGKLV